MAFRRANRAPRPLDEPALQELAIAYVGRFATTRAKLRGYLERKIRERGWNGQNEADPAGIAERMAQQGFIDDAAYAEAKARSLTSRGYGQRRVAEALRGAGISEPDGEIARNLSQAEAVAAALRFAQRRRIGPFATVAGGPAEREKAIGAMVRAGHGFDLAKAIARLSPGAAVDADALGELIRHRNV